MQKLMLLTILCFLFFIINAQDTAATKTAKVYTDSAGKKYMQTSTGGRVYLGKIILADSLNKNNTEAKNDSAKKIGGFATMTDVFKPEMTFWEKFKFYFFYFKQQNPFMFWSLLVIVCLWVLKMLYKLFDR